MTWEVIATIIGAVLGSQTLVELIRIFRNRKTDGRIEEAHADNEELERFASCAPSYSSS